MCTKSSSLTAAIFPLLFLLAFKFSEEQETQRRESEPFNTSLAPACSQSGCANPTCSNCSLCCVIICVAALICVPYLFMCPCVRACFPRIHRCGRAPPTACTSHRATRSTARSAAGTSTRKVMGEFFTNSFKKITWLLVCSWKKSKWLYIMCV